MKIAFYLRYAFRSVYREGQRSLLSIISIAFGVLSLVAMLQLAQIIEDGLLVEPHLKVGGDISLSRAAGVFTAEYIPELDRLKNVGVIDKYDIRARAATIFIKTESSGEVIFANRVTGVDPETYPLYGVVGLRSPASTSFSDAIRTPGSVAITGDIADEHGLDIGSSISLSSTSIPPVQVTVSGIIDHLPDRAGRSVFFSLETAALLSDGHPLVYQAAAIWKDREQDGPRLEQAGWKFHRASEMEMSKTQDLFKFSLGGAGILGLLIGGIGVANTINVVLSRRKKEVATLKTIGYRQRDLLALFGIETAMLGLFGGIIGVTIASFLSHRFMRMLDVMMPIMLEYRLDIWILAGGLLTGVLTALIFGLAAIVKTSGLRPIFLLRALTIPRRRTTQLRTAGLYVFLLFLFAVLSSVILGSILWGFGTVLFGLVGLATIGLLFGGFLWLLVRIPVPNMPLLTMARSNLRHHPVRAIYALVALFVGVFSIGFATTAMLNAQGRAEARFSAPDGYNVMVFGRPAEAEQITAALENEEISDVHFNFPLAAKISTGSDVQLDVSGLEGREIADRFWDVLPPDSIVSDVENPAFAPAFLADRLALGDSFSVETSTGSASLRVAGFYSPNDDIDLMAPATSKIIVSHEIVHDLGGSVVNVVAMIQVDRLEATVANLGRRLPSSLVVSKAVLGNYMQQVFRSLFWFVIAITALAFVAGAVLIANAVGLAMVERRREMGILKAVGYTSGNVLNTILAENGLLGLLSGVTGMVGVQIAIFFFNMRDPTANLSLGLLPAAVLVLISIGLALLSATLVAWGPTHARPLSVLRSE